MSRHRKDTELTDPVPHYEPLYRGGPRPHDTTPIITPGPLAADPNPEPPEPPEPRHTQGFFWALTGFTIMAAALALAVWLVRVIDKPVCPHQPPVPTVTVTATPPEPGR